MNAFVMLGAALVLVAAGTGPANARPEAPYQYSAPSSQSFASASASASVSYESSGGSAAPVYGPPAQQPVIHKHVYVHVPPPEPEYAPARRPIAVAPPQKHYKIVFIKAPSAPAPTAPIIPLQPQNEEKTLVYVLVKRPDEQPDIVIPTAAPTQPSKPEVYFIRYKTQKAPDAAGPYPESIAPAPAGDYGAPAAGPAAGPPAPPGGAYGVPR